MVFLTLSATISSLRPPPCPANTSRTCPTPHGIQIAVLYLGLYLFAIGNGGIKPNVSTLGADQFDEGDPNERKHMSHFFNWFYFIISIGSLFSVTLFVYIQVTANYKSFSFSSGLL
jgi:peptide/histidine transporter 3/4